MIRFAALLALLALAACDAASASQAAPSGSPQATGSASPSPSASTSPTASSTPKEKPMPNENLLNPAKCNETAPAEFQAKFDTSKGVFVIKVTRDWAPQGADRFYNLVKNGYYNDCRFFRAIKDFMVQFGINGDPKVNEKWQPARIKDDQLKQGNKRGRITFAMAGPDTRTTQLFINFKDNNNLDGMGFPSFGEVVEGMTVVDSLYQGYGEGAPRGAGPAQNRVQSEGNAYLNQDFPKLDFIKTATIVEAKKMLK